MSYRKITVDGVDYRWMTWKTATKVQTLDKHGKVVGSKQYENVDWGTPLISCDYEDGRRETGGPLRYTEHGFVVSTGDVHGMIIGDRRWSVHPERTVTGLTGDPFAGEIEQKHILVDNCPDCLYDSWCNT